MSYNPAPIPESQQSALDALDPSKPGSQQNYTSGLGHTNPTPSGQVESRETHNSAPVGSGAAGVEALKGEARAAPESRVADHDYPNVPATTEPQQAATGPGTGTVQQEKVPFKDQAAGYAKKIHGTVFGNQEEKELGDKKIHGQI